MNKSTVAILVNYAVGFRPIEPKAEWPTLGIHNPWLSDYFTRGRIGKTSLSDLEFRILLNKSRSLRETEEEMVRQAMKSRLLSYNYK